MVSLQLSETRLIESLYDDSEGDVEFGTVLSSAQIDDDDALAELIEIDGRQRLSRGLYVDLQRYLEAVPDLPHRAVALDSAVDFALRSLSGTGETAPHALDTLVDNYPFLEQQIREAAALNNALWSTSGVRQQIQPKARRLPSGFGPQTPNGLYRYELQRLLGSGAAGQVYLAIDRLLSDESHKATVAIKILSDRNRTVWGRQQLSDEATKARRITHANVVRVLDRGVTDSNEDFLVFEYIQGGDLSKWLTTHGPKVDQRKAAQMLLMIARGIHAAHVAGLVHCDLKPSNILLTKDESPKVTDFGIAMRIGDNSFELGGHRSNAPLGNLAFISPEQFRMEPGMTAAPSDVYALGGLLYHMLTGNLPNGQTAAQISEAHSTRSIDSHSPELASFTKHISPTLRLICKRALSPDPHNRHHSAAELANDLESWLNHEPVRWTKPSLPRTAALWTTRNPGVVAVLLLLITAVALGTASTRHFADSANDQRLKEAAALYNLEVRNYEIGMIAPIVDDMYSLLLSDKMRSKSAITQNEVSPEGTSDPRFAKLTFKQRLLQRQETLDNKLDRNWLESTSLSHNQIAMLIELTCIAMKADRKADADQLLTKLAELSESDNSMLPELKDEIVMVQQCRQIEKIVSRTRALRRYADKTITDKDLKTAKAIEASLFPAFYRHQWNIENIQTRSLVHTRLLDLYGPWALNQIDDFKPLTREGFDPTIPNSQSRF